MNLQMLNVAFDHYKAVFRTLTLLTFCFEEYLSALFKMKIITSSLLTIA